MRGIEAQFLALQKGFNELIPQHLLKPFDDRELEVGVLTASVCYNCRITNMRSNHTNKELIKCIGSRVHVEYYLRTWKKLVNNKLHV